MRGVLRGYFIMIIHYGGSPRFMWQLEKTGEGFSGQKCGVILNLQIEACVKAMMVYSQSAIHHGSVVLCNNKEFHSTELALLEQFGDMEFPNIPTYPFHCQCIFIDH